jgi:hypothetical protein
MASSHLIQFVSDFFPDAHALTVKYVAPLLRRHVGVPLEMCVAAEPSVLVDLPPAVARLASSVTAALATSSSAASNIGADAGAAMQMLVRNPTLLPIQLTGIALGLVGWFAFRQCAEERIEWSRQFRAMRSLAWAFLFSAAMNATSIGAHNLCSRGSFAWEAFRLFDLAFTGASSLCLACVPFAVPHIAHVGIMFATIGYTILGDSTRPLHGWPYTAELVYIGAMFVATVLLGLRLHRIGRGFNFDYAICLTGLAIILVAIPLDHQLCALSAAVGGGGRLTAVHLVFFGCDVVFFGLLRYGLDAPVQVRKRGGSAGHDREESWEQQQQPPLPDLSAPVARSK